MCAGDMTLVPVKWEANKNWLFPSFRAAHTCRNYQDLKEWTMNRGASDPEMLVKNAERYKKTGSFQHF